MSLDNFESGRTRTMFLLPEKPQAGASVVPEKAMLVRVDEGIYRLIEEGRRDLLLKGQLVQVITDDVGKIAVDPVRLILYETDVLSDDF